MSIRPDITELIDFLNSLVRVDPEAMAALMAARVPCGNDLATHPTVQVSGSDTSSGEFRVGILGILNGYAGAYDDGPRKGWGPISAIVEANGELSGFIQTPNE